MIIHQSGRYQITLSDDKTKYLIINTSTGVVEKDTTILPEAIDMALFFEEKLKMFENSKQETNVIELNG